MGKQLITMEDAVGNKVLITLHKQAYEMLGDVQGIDSQSFVAKVVGIDGLGLWLENPDYCTKPVYTDAGEYIPPEEREIVCHRAIILLRYDYIQTIMQYPDRAVFTPGEEEPEIGFKAKAMRQEANDG